MKLTNEICEDIAWKSGAIFDLNGKKGVTFKHETLVTYTANVLKFSPSFVEKDEIKQEIEKCKSILTEELNIAIEGALEHGWNADQTANALLGILEMAQVRFDNLSRKLD